MYCSGSRIQQCCQEGGAYCTCLVWAEISWSCIHKPQQVVYMSLSMNQSDHDLWMQAPTWHGDEAKYYMYLLLHI